MKQHFFSVTIGSDGETAENEFQVLAANAETAARKAWRVYRKSPPYLVGHARVEKVILVGTPE